MGTKFKKRGLIWLFIFAVSGYYFFYYSNIYLESFSDRFDDKTGIYGPSYFVIQYPTHKAIFHSNLTYSPGMIFYSLASSAIFINEVDTKTFTVLGKYYAKDKNGVFYVQDSVKLLHSSPNEPVKLLGEHYIAIGNRVYHQDKEMVGAQASDFTFLEEEYPIPNNGDPYYDTKDYIQRFARSNKIIFFGEKIVSAQKDAVYIKPKSMTEGTPCESEKPFAAFNNLGEIDNTSLISCGINKTEKNIPVVIDSETFTVLSHVYTKDKNYVYFNMGTERDVPEAELLRVVDYANPTSFTVDLSQESTGSNQQHTQYNEGSSGLDLYSEGCRVYPTKSPIRLPAGKGGYCRYIEL